MDLVNTNGAMALITKEITSTASRVEKAPTVTSQERSTKVNGPMASKKAKALFTPQPTKS